MKQIVKFGPVVFLLAACLGLLVRYRATEAGQVRPKAAAKPPRPKTAAAPGSASLQTHRNIGKAYYEQGKYAEAVSEFRKVIASGHALATDHLDLGLALMQANSLDAALGELTTAKQMDAKLVAAEYNLGILYKRELRYPDAENALKRVIDAEPRDPAAWFNLGTVYFAEKKLEQALDAHQHVIQMGFGRAQNFYVASLFHTFTLLVRLKRKAEADEVLAVHTKFRDKVPNISLQNPALEGGKYGAILVPIAPAGMAARGGAPQATTFREITSELGIAWPESAAANPQPELTHIKSSDYSLDFARSRLLPGFGPSIAIGDYDGDGRPDLYVVMPGAKNHLYHNDGNGRFTDVTAKAGVEGDGGGLTASFADYDNSGHPSLFVAGLGGVALYRNKGDGTFADETEKAGLRGEPGELATRAVLFDADNDGFLDLATTVYTDLTAPPQKESFGFPGDFAGAPSHFFRNNGDGSFKDLTSSAGLASARGRVRAAVFADFDDDGYVDLLMVRDDGPPLLFMNQGEDKFLERTAEAGAGLANSGALDAQVADFDHDGKFDIALWSSSGCAVLFNRGDAKFEPVQTCKSVDPPRNLLAQRGAVADVDGDGSDDLLAADNAGHWHFIANRAGRFEEAPLKLPGSTDTAGQPGLRVARHFYKALPWLAPAWLSQPGKLDLVAFTPEGRLAAFERVAPPSRWLEVRLDGYKSNKQGTGTIVEFKAGNFYKKVEATGNAVRVFAGDLAKLDVVRVTWPNQIVQNTIDVATNRPIEIRESERLASSCPFLYVWDGQRYVFLTDVLGVAPLGELAPDGTRLAPNPEEFVRLPANLPHQNGVYTFQITDELREVEYLDQARLIAVDHPPTEEIYANEIYSSSPAPPTLYAVRAKHFPVSATDDRGSDVLPLIREADGRYPDRFRRNRIPGLAESHTLTLDPGDLPDTGHVALWLSGWVLWTDSNASRALISNSKLSVIPPYLQVRDGHGEWVTVIPDMGLPSGTNRAMRVDLSGKFLSRDREVRIVTNLCVYWDQIFFSTDDVPLPMVSPTPNGAGAKLPAPMHALLLHGDEDITAVMTTAELPLRAADLHYRGFSKPASDPEHLKPDSFDYMTLLAEAPWNPMRGNYTRYGPVKSLLERADDQLVTMATGDELTLRFSTQDAGRLNRGWKRELFLYLRGWAKDGEPNTAYSRTVEPLPFGNMGNYPPAVERPPESAEYRRYLREYQTRPGYLLIPPLGPAVR